MTWVIRSDSTTRADGLAIGDVERDDVRVGGRPFAGHQSQPAAFRRKVRADRVDTVLEQQLHRPRADAAGRTGHEVARGIRRSACDQAAGTGRVRPNAPRSPAPAMSSSLMPSTSWRIAPVCCPSSGGTRRTDDGVPEKRTGLPTTRIGPAVG